MADRTLPWPIQDAIDIMAGRHTLSKYIPPVLWLFDDYTKMAGGTGPLVYPAAHVYTFTGLYYLTDRGKNILLAQQLFAVFIFVLRCFNDCFAAFFLWLSIFCFQRRMWTLGAVAYAWGLGIKMSLLLVLPAVAVVLFLGRGLRGSLRLLWLVLQVQVAMAVPFLTTNAGGYLGRAFELSRQFKYEWTVNWRMLPEDVFLSRELAVALLAGHVGVLLLFIGNRWVARATAGRSPWAMIPDLLRLRSPFRTRREEEDVAGRVTPDLVMSTMLTANVVGLLFARSLHYQFYAYLSWATPYLIWRAGRAGAGVWAVWILQEYAWNVFPSTDLSSAIVVASLLFTVCAAYLAPAEEEMHADDGDEQQLSAATESSKTR
ncbi:alpha-1,3-mannosyltransferase [Geosmithia morbida]|uniref:Dol-P-Man:Man(5)GlcNAc(2)-PP-Dol alpha-1,3-mannosyltransferase n=1 Tax=Geosmithia morbida TaxID=1094350 RepID=A0A9P4Z443_9HYPO|nr:alpha-1,3-mannosyltransferase [Geosmithia morbida]KAF4126898.1 alpha-1,3-mannosyltransferase [Geosmithia morbida]